MTLEGMQIGHYRLLRFIGRGAMGEVYLAEDTRIARRVAIKIMRNEVNTYPNVQATDEALRLFQREMKAIASLDHPNILPLFDFGEETIDKTTYTYMVMPFRPEGSLVDWLQQRNSAELLSPQEVIQIVHQVADALQHAHNRHLMHLDVKLSNFLMRHHEDSSRRPDVLLSDFGISKFNTATSTASQTIRGTPPYMAPEQWVGTPVAATDQYALAIMAYQLLTGRFPFEGNMQQVMFKHFQERPQPPSAFNPGIPPSVDRVILRALEKKPEDRFPSIQTFATAFEQAWPSEGPHVPPPPPPTQYVPPAPPPIQYAPPATPQFPVNIPGYAPIPYVPPPVPSPSSKKPGIPWRAAIIGLIALAVISGLVFALSKINSSPTTVSNPTPTPTTLTTGTIAQLAQQYHGTRVDPSNPVQYTVTLIVNDPNQQQDFTATMTITQTGYVYNCSSGNVTSNGSITYQCTSADNAHHFTFDGTIYNNGDIIGTEHYTQGEGIDNDSLTPG